MKHIHWGNTPISPLAQGGDSGWVQRDGEPFYKIANYQTMQPFFIAVVSGSEHWMFLSSTGGMTCGRRNPDSALFPYYTDDKIHDAGATTGSATLLLAEREGRVHLWQPFTMGLPGYGIERNLYKNLPGTRLVYEEINHDLALAFSCAWTTSERYGFVKQAALRNLGEAACDVEILDGLRNLLPYGITRQMQVELSTLLDGYKQAERVPGIAAGVYSLSSIQTDRAEPCEALRATVAWSTGLDANAVLLTEDQVNAFCRGAGVSEEHRARGKRGAFFVQSAFTLPAASEKSWHMAADVNQGPARLPALLEEIRRGVAAETIEADVARGTRRLVSLVHGADGCQKSSDAIVAARHFSNTLFNIMRGGTFYDGYGFPREDFLQFAGTWNHPSRDAFAELLGAHDGPLTLETVAAAAADSGDPDLERLALEYLPLTFSRRHGDPSRPWNRFSIDIRNADGSDKLHFQGNWRDIFQNWEALSLSYPGYIENFIAKFVNASTADGYNPYRITRDGIDWEVLEADNSWSNIGYWGDHQINYLVKLLEQSTRYHPGTLGSLLEKEIFVYANVPYRIKRYAELLRDPRDSITYDHAAADAIARRTEAIGSDGKLLALRDGTIHRVNLLEKLLVPALVKIGNLVPDGGIWMNTQRPEWNDANNALVGYGLSMVTLCYLRRYLVLLDGVLGDHAADEYPVSAEVQSFFAALGGVLREFRPAGDSATTPAQRKAAMDSLGAAGEAYRERVYAGLSGQKAALEKAGLKQFIELALEHLDHCIGANRRPDGLYHAYNLIHFDRAGFGVEHLQEMLEGQVAILSSGFLGPQESLELLTRLRASRIYRPDQNSYMLYPDREQVPFLERNVIPPAVLEASPWLVAELDAGRTGLVERDVEGNFHFNGDFRNAADLRAVLERRDDCSAEDAAAVLEVYETVFRHRAFTGRSGSMFKYEGLGCIYWHMVSKLLLATAEVIAGAGPATDQDTLDGLLERYDDIKEGLGIHKAPEHYGAFPTDPYSHTPGFSGVQQPGMTGQVKEDIITRFMELGVDIRDGQIGFRPVMLGAGEFLAEPATWAYANDDGEVTEELPAGSLAFSLCGVPVIYRLAEQQAIAVVTADGDSHRADGDLLGRQWSQSLFRRDGRVRKIIVDLPPAAVR